MYLKDWIKKHPITAHWDNDIYFYVRYENESEYREVRCLSEYYDCICINCKQIEVLKGHLTDLYVYYDLKVKTVFTLKDFIDYFELLNPAVLKVKGQKTALTLNPYNLYKYRDHIVRGFRVGKNNCNYIWIK